jgi:hypothetical protein
MELNDLKSAWRHVNGTEKSVTDLQKMTKIANLPSIKKIRTKLIAEVIGLTLFSFIYYDWFDGDQKPMYANLLLLSSLFLYILNNVTGYIAVIWPVIGNSLKTSIQDYLVRIKRLSVFSLIISFLYSISLILFFTSVINFTGEKQLILICLIIFLLTMTYSSFRTWTKWINSLSRRVKEFSLDDE